MGTETTLSAKVTADLTDFNRKFGEMRSTLDGVGKAPGTVAASTSSAADAIEQSTGRWKAAFVGAAVAIGAGVLTAAERIGEWTREAAAAAEKVEQLSQQTGIAQTTLESWSVALNRTGTDTSVFAQAFKALSKDIETARGAADFSKTKFAEMGLTLHDLGSTETVIRAVADRIATMTDPAERARFATDLLGKAGLALLPAFSQGSAGLDAAAQKAREFGLVLDESARTNLLKYDDALDDLGKAWDGFKTKVGAAAAPILTKGVELAEASIVMSGKIVDTIVRMVEGVRSAFAALGRIMDGVREKTEAVKAFFHDMWTAVTRRSYVPDMVDEIGHHMNRLQSVMVQKAADGTERTKLTFYRLRGTAPATVGQTVDEIGQHMKKLDANLTAPARRAAISVENIFRGMTFTAADVLEDLRERASYTAGAMVQSLSGAFAGALQGTANWSQFGQQILNQFLTNAIGMVLTWTTTWAAGEMLRLATTQGVNTAIATSTAATMNVMTTVVGTAMTGLKLLTLGVARAAIGVVGTVIAAITPIVVTVATVVGTVMSTIGAMLMELGTAMQSIPIVGTILGAIMIGMGGVAMAAGAALPGVVAGILGGLAAGVGALGAAIPAFAQGGAVFGPTLALVGENATRSDPEFIGHARHFGFGDRRPVEIRIDLAGEPILRYVLHNLGSDFHLKGYAS